MSCDVGLGILQRESTVVPSLSASTMIVSTTVVVSSILEGGPAARAGTIEVGDVIVAIDGRVVRNIEDCLKRIMGEENSVLQLRCRRGPKEFNISIIRKLPRSKKQVPNQSITERILCQSAGKDDDMLGSIRYRAQRVGVEMRWHVIEVTKGLFDVNRMAIDIKQALLLQEVETTQILNGQREKHLHYGRTLQRTVLLRIQAVADKIAEMNSAFDFSNEEENALYPNSDVIRSLHSQSDLYAKFSNKPDSECICSEGHDHSDRPEDCHATFPAKLDKALKKIEIQASKMQQQNENLGRQNQNVIDLESKLSYYEEKLGLYAKQVDLNKSQLLDAQDALKHEKEARNIYSLHITLLQAELEGIRREFIQVQSSLIFNTEENVIRPKFEGMEFKIIEPQAGNPSEAIGKNIHHGLAAYSDERVQVLDFGPGLTAGLHDEKICKKVNYQAAVYGTANVPSDGLNGEKGLQFDGVRGNEKVPSLIYLDNEKNTSPSASEALENLLLEAREQEGQVHENESDNMLQLVSGPSLEDLMVAANEHIAESQLHIKQLIAESAVLRQRLGAYEETNSASMSLGKQLEEHLQECKQNTEDCRSIDISTCVQETQTMDINEITSVVADRSDLHSVIEVCTQVADELRSRLMTAESDHASSAKHAEVLRKQVLDYKGILKRDEEIRQELLMFLSVLHSELLFCHHEIVDLSPSFVENPFDFRIDAGSIAFEPEPAETLEDVDQKVFELQSALNCKQEVSDLRSRLSSCEEQLGFSQWQVKSLCEQLQQYREVVRFGQVAGSALAHHSETVTRQRELDISRIRLASAEEQFIATLLRGHIDRQNVLSLQLEELQQVLHIDRQRLLDQLEEFSLELESFKSALWVDFKEFTQNLSDKHNKIITLESKLQNVESFREANELAMQLNIAKLEAGTKEIERLKSYFHDCQQHKANLECENENLRQKLQHAEAALQAQHEEASVVFSYLVQKHAHEMSGLSSLLHTRNLDNVISSNADLQNESDVYSKFQARSSQGAGMQTSAAEHAQSPAFFDQNSGYWERGSHDVMSGNDERQPMNTNFGRQEQKLVQKAGMKQNKSNGDIMLKDRSPSQEGHINSGSEMSGNEDGQSLSRGEEDDMQAWSDNLTDSLVQGDIEYDSERTSERIASPAITKGKPAYTVNLAQENVVRSKNNRVFDVSPGNREDIQREKAYKRTSTGGLQYPSSEQSSKHESDRGKVGTAARGAGSRPERTDVRKSSGTYEGRAKLSQPDFSVRTKETLNGNPNNSASTAERFTHAPHDLEQKSLQAGRSGGEQREIDRWCQKYYKYLHRSSASLQE